MYTVRPRDLWALALPVVLALTQRSIGQASLHGSKFPAYGRTCKICRLRIHGLALEMNSCFMKLACLRNEHYGGKLPSEVLAR